MFWWYLTSLYLTSLYSFFYFIFLPGLFYSDHHYRSRNNPLRCSFEKFISRSTMIFIRIVRRIFFFLFNWRTDVIFMLFIFKTCLNNLGCLNNQLYPRLLFAIWLCRALNELDFRYITGRCITTSFLNDTHTVLVKIDRYRIYTCKFFKYHVYLTITASLIYSKMYYIFPFFSMCICLIFIFIYKFLHTTDMPMANSGGRQLT